MQALEQARLDGAEITNDALLAAFAAARTIDGSATLANTGVGSVVYAVRPGDGSAREQAASCQKVLGTFANIAKKEYATKRYRSNLINWGMLPFLCEADPLRRRPVPVRAGRPRRGPSRRRRDTGLCHRRRARYAFHAAPCRFDRRRAQDHRAGCLINYYRDETEF